MEEVNVIFLEVFESQTRSYQSNPLFFVENNAKNICLKFELCIIYFVIMYSFYVLYPSEVSSTLIVLSNKDSIFSLTILLKHTARTVQGVFDSFNRLLARKSLSFSHSICSFILPRMFSRFGEYFIRIVISSAVPMVSRKILVFLVTSLTESDNE